MAVKSLKKGYLALAASMLLVAQAQATELLNSSYDVSRELFAALTRLLSSSGRKTMAGTS
ncbi:sulfate and thiosulfate binding protein CysP [Klebsiella pneumoniae]|nr:sulfate and thiosulfate binding protein CysP [Klebsiella pneumoniae]